VDVERHDGIGMNAFFLAHVTTPILLVKARIRAESSAFREFSNRS
jgi:hypothetical protein